MNKSTKTSCKQNLPAFLEPQISSPLNRFDLKYLFMTITLHRFHFQLIYSVAFTVIFTLVILRANITATYAIYLTTCSTRRSTYESRNIQVPIRRRDGFEQAGTHKFELRILTNVYQTRKTTNDLQ